MKFGYLLFAVVLVGCGSTSRDVSSTPSAAPPSKPRVATEKNDSPPITEEQLGLKFYPGAKVITSTGKGKTVSANLETSDPVEKVVAFYEKELGAKASGKDLISIDGSKGGTKYAVVVLKMNDTTSISIMGGE